MPNCSGTLLKHLLELNTRKYMEEGWLNLLSCMVMLQVPITCGKIARRSVIYYGKRNEKDGTIAISLGCMERIVEHCNYVRSMKKLLPSLEWLLNDTEEHFTIYVFG